MKKCPQASKTFRKAVLAALCDAKVLVAAKKTSKKDKKKRLSFSPSQFSETFIDYFYRSTVTFRPVDYNKFNGACVFIFAKNASVTNAQFNELLALLKLHAKSNDGESASRPRISFFRRSEIESLVAKTFESFSLYADVITQKDVRDLFRVARRIFEDALYEVCKSTIVVDIYATSAVVLVPADIVINIEHVIAESGYIHSGGAKIYNKKLETCVYDDLNHNIKTFVDRSDPKSTILVPFCEESKLPRHDEDIVSIRNGLDGLKLSLRRTHVQNKKFIDIVQNIISDSEGKITPIIGLDGYKSEQALIDRATIHQNSIWMVVDRNISTESHKINESEKYLICYEQAFINNNHFLVFKERKPGWYAPVTLPHTLSTAVVNIGRAALRQRPPQSGKKIILDPFCGSGTTLIDAAIRCPDAIIIGLDRNPIVPQIVEDNWAFLFRDINEIDNAMEPIFDRISSILSSENQNHEFRRSLLADDDISNLIDQGDLDSNLYRAARLVRTFIGGKFNDIESLDDRLRVFLDDEFKSFHANELTKLTQLNRYVFYALWRALCSHSSSMRLSPVGWQKLIASEFERCVSEFRFMKDRERHISIVQDGDRLFGRASKFFSPATFVHREECKKRVKVSFYDEKAPEIDSVDHWEPGVYVLNVKDSVEFLKQHKFSADLVVTDPPYGFNTLEGKGHALNKMFADLPDALVANCKPSSTLMLVLPAFARNGRVIPFNQTRDIFVRNIISSSANRGMNCVEYVYGNPKPKDVFRRPLTWSSNRVLDRNILQFNFLAGG